MNTHDGNPRPLKAGMLAAIATVLILLTAALTAAPAMAEFGFETVDLVSLNADGTPATQAGSHPYEEISTFKMNYLGEPFSAKTDGDTKDAVLELPPGFIGSATSYPRCSSVDFSTRAADGTSPNCPNSTAVGVAQVNVLAPIAFIPGRIFNLVPPVGAVARLGFKVLGETVAIDIRAKQSGDNNLIGSTTNVPQIIPFYGGIIRLWGVPADPSHDSLRGSCLLAQTVGVFEPIYESLGDCPTETPELPFLTLPGSCAGPLQTLFKVDSWQEPDRVVERTSTTHDNAQPPNPQGFTGCGKLDYAPRLETQPTSDEAEAGTGLDVNVDFHDEGLENAGGLVESQTKKAVVTLPEGVTINPSVGEGLGVCTPADIKREALDAAPGEGCPNSSKIGTLLIESPLVNEPVEGSVFLAEEDDPITTEPGAENPFDSLIALYLVLKNQNLGAMVIRPLKVEPDPKTGRLVATLENVPQIPFGHFNFHFKEGTRAALITPATCGTYTTEAQFYPWSDPSNPRTLTSSFEITKGKNGAPCPPEGIPPFHPTFQAGSINNNAGSFSPFDMRLIREDGEQDMTKFSAVLPPGELGSLAGVSKCPDSAIAVAKAKTGRQELASPSCPANSLIGHTLAGAGVGSALTYVKGFVYLGGPYHGDPLSVIAITPAVAGPFDAGTVVVQEALTLNPKTAEVEVDGSRSDPIPHIIKGIVLKLRDLRLYVDRQNFTLNPTSCDESSARSVLFGSYLNVLDPSDDRPVDLSTRYQAANCLNLGFKPDLKLNLKGGTKRGGHPALKAIYTPRPGDANVKGLVVRLPRSAFLDQAHIKTICTRVQFAAGGGNGEQCPAASKYGFIKAWTPLLDEPLEGPVFLRSSNHKLPDLVFALHGLVNIEVDTRIDSKNGGIRATVEDTPDAPLSKVDLRMQGAKKGLIINSRNLCGAPSHADVAFTGHNGKQFSAKPLMKPECGGKRARKRHQR